MSELKDNQLLAAYAVERSERAFSALVERHVGLVYSTALRQVGDRMLAEEITQNVFLGLARKPEAFRNESTVAGWLYKTTLLQARQQIRSELRRKRREETAVELGTVTGEREAGWEILAALLDEGLLALREKDRLAVVLRFLEGRGLREVGDILGVSEDAAQKRVAKALDALTRFFRRRGFLVPALTLSAPVFVSVIQAAPSGLAGAIARSAVQQASAAPLSAGGVLLAKLAGMKTAHIAVICLVIGAMPLAMEWHALAHTRAAHAQVAADLRSAEEGLSRAQSDLAGLQKQESDAGTHLVVARKQSQDRLNSGAALEMYPWVENSDYVRVPKSLVSNVRLAMPVNFTNYIFSLSDEMCGLLRLNAESAGKINAAIVDARRQYLAIRAEHFHPTDERVQIPRRDPPEESVGFQLEAFPEQGAKVRASLDAVLLAELGEERQALFWSYAGPMISPEFGRFGNDDRYYTFSLRKTPRPEVCVAMESTHFTPGGVRGRSMSERDFPPEEDAYAPEVLKPTLARWRAAVESAKVPATDGGAP
jgi:RNA polymerase sigma factor (sigma-70 family)